MIALAFNGVAGPITEELYFRGHLLPRLERYGRWAPVINTALFAIYHFFSPWRYPAIFLGFLPIMWTAAFKGAWQSPRFGRIRPLGRFRAHIGRCSASRTRASRRRQLERER